MILTYSNLNRKTILNNLEKIKSFYDKKDIIRREFRNIIKFR